MTGRIFKVAFLIALMGSMGTFAEAANRDLTARDAWARATAPGAPAGAAFMVIENRADAGDALVSADAGVADSVELHTHTMDAGVMKMRKVERIAIPAKGETALKPGGLHVMFIGLKAPLVEGQSFNLGLTFEKAGRIVVPVTVRSIWAR